MKNRNFEYALGLARLIQLNEAIPHGAVMIDGTFKTCIKINGMYVENYVEIECLDEELARKTAERLLIETTISGKVVLNSDDETVKHAIKTILKKSNKAQNYIEYKKRQALKSHTGGSNGQY